MAFKPAAFFSRLSKNERNRIADYLREETVGGVLLLIAAVTALIWANSPYGDAYKSLSHTYLAIPVIGIEMSLAHWAADFLLAIFFLVVGFELKQEFLFGSLSEPAKAVVPIAAALGGMLFPALIFVSVNSVMAGEYASAWGIPIATDIAFALAVLAVFGKNLPVELRAFLLTLAVVDDLGAISVIAIFYSHGFELNYFVAALLTLAVYAGAQSRQIRSLWIHIPLGFAAWSFMYLSGIHATVAGVLLGLLTSAKKRNGEAESPLEAAAHKIHPWSAGFAVPVFAFFAAGVDLRGADIATSLSSPLFIGIVLGLVIGKPFGILLTAWTLARFTKAELSAGISWKDVFAIGVLAGIGFTVSLLISELAFLDSTSSANVAKLGVLSASAVATTFAIGALRLSKNRAKAL